MRLLLFFIGFFVLNSSSFSQEKKVEGKILTNGRPLGFASVAVKTEGGQILAFAQANEGGLFSIPLSTQQWNAFYWLEVRRLGFESVTKTKVENQDFYEIAMLEKPHQIEEVLVKRKMIDAKGDTLIYDVSSFLQTGDQSIGDVIRRMPGMEVQSGGKILYNGQEISHLYIDGDDLLQGRYALATRAIPHRMVGRVEVLKNHEPIKMLRDVSFSDKIAVNLSLKADKQLHVASEIKLGAGIPEVYEGSWNGMIFNKKLKTLNAIQSNNSGQDLRQDFRDFSLSYSPFYTDIYQNLNFLNSVTVSEPFINYNRYYDNLSGSIQINYLTNFENDWQLRTNGVFWKDKNHFNYLHNLKYLVDNLSEYTEKQQMTQNAELALINLNLKKNGERFYLDSRFQFDYEDKHNLSQLSFNQDGWNLDLTSTQYMLTSTNRAILKLKDQKTWDFDYMLVFQKVPQVFSSLAEQGSVYSQRYENPMWNHKFSTKFINAKNSYFRQNYTIIFQSQSMNLQSLLNSWQEEGMILDPDLLRNQLNWKQNKATLNSEWVLSGKGIRTHFNVPMHLQALQYDDVQNALNYDSRKLYFEPSITSYFSLFNNELMVRYGYKRHFGGIDGAFRGIIMRNFGYFESNQNSIIPSSENYGGAIHYKIEKPESFFFTNLGFTHNLSFNTILKSQNLHDNYIENISIYAPHRNQRWSLSSEISKYLLLLKTNLKIAPQYTQSYSHTLLNENAYEATFHQYDLNHEIEFPTLKKLRILWYGGQRWTQSANASQNLFKSETNLSISFPITSTLFIKGDYNLIHYKRQTMNAQNYQFIDLLARFTPKKSKLNFELSIQNLGNIQQYSQIFEDPFKISESHYQLRGRMIMAYVKFNIF